MLTVSAIAVYTRSSLLAFSEFAMPGRRVAYNLMLAAGG